MIPRECKRLAEVDFPIAEVSRHAAREKSIRHGHPSTLHLWWARRPLASSRSVLLALLLPDPCDSHCPSSFKDAARPALRGVGCDKGSSDGALREGLLKFIAEFANWDLADKPAYVQAARGLVRAAHDRAPPLAVDPFAGGGSIPLEAIRVGCDTFASDLNPVACLILKVMLEEIPRRGPHLSEEILRAGEKIREEATENLADLYPSDRNGSPIAYLWARTVRCEAPNCGAEIPLLRSFWLCKKPNRRVALRHAVEKARDDSPQVVLDIFEPSGSGDVQAGTMSRGRASCLCCGTTLSPARVRAQLTVQSGGADVVFDDEGRRIGGARITAVVTRNPARPGRRYRVPTDRDYSAVLVAQERLAETLAQWEESGRPGLCPVPDEPLPLMSGTFNVPLYGMDNWGSLFSARQKVAMVEFARLTARAGSQQQALSLALSRLANAGSSLSRWHTGGEKHEGVYARQALPMVWDFSEGNPLSDSTGGYAGACKWVSQVAARLPTCQPGQVEMNDAVDHPLPDKSVDVWFTDPPYYYAIPYADLSDFFFVWLKRTLSQHTLMHHALLHESGLTPKEQEICEMARWDQVRYAHKDKGFFEDGMAAAFAEGRRVLGDDGIGSVVFAHKTTDGWEALLAGLIRGGWTITGSWPIATEMASRLRARESAALATSVHLICRPRSAKADVGDWADVLRELPTRVGEWMERLQSEGVRGADLVFACVGPALEVYSRFREVETAEGGRVGLREYLEKVWEVVGRTALRQVLEADGSDDLNQVLEEDARLTALFLWTMQSTEGRADEASRSGEGDTGRRSGYTLPYDVVRRFAQPMGIDLDASTGKVVNQKKGVVHLLSLAERAKVLFGGDSAPTRMERTTTGLDADQLTLFDDFEVEGTLGTMSEPEVAFDSSPSRATTLDRIHTGMVLQAGGNAAALRSLIEEERRRGPGFLRLANALSALYPSGSQEKRVLDAMLLAVPR